MALRILVIEDHPAILEMIRYLLQAYGHTPLLAADGAEGLQTAERELPDLILCDIQLPVMDGYEVVLNLKRNPRLAPIPVIALTAFAMVGDRDRVLAAGFDGYMAKPISPQTFVAEVETHAGYLRGRPVQPALQSPRQAAPIQEPRRKPLVETRRPTILVIDNVAANRDLAKHVIEAAGYRVLIARNVDEALVLAKETTPDLALCDLHMPGKDGNDFIRAIRADAILGSLPIVIISASVYPERDSQSSLDLGASRYLQRPADPRIILNEIASCLSSQRDAKMIGGGAANRRGEAWQ